jgi:hypothetical protein
MPISLNHFKKIRVIEMDETLVGAIIGGAISGGVGIIIARYTSRLKDNEWMKQNVYTKLYDWIVSRVNTFQFDDELVYARQTVSQLTASEYAKMDKKIKKKFDTFVNEGTKWDDMFGDIRNRYTDERTKIFESLCKPLKDSNLLNDRNYVEIGNEGVYAIRSLLDPFFTVLIVPTINSGEILYQKMKEYAQKKNLSQLEYLEEIKKQRPDFFELLSNGLHKLRDETLSVATHAQLMDQAKKTQYALSELKASLKNKI